MFLLVLVVTLVLLPITIVEDPSFPKSETFRTPLANQESLPSLTTLQTCEMHEGKNVLISSTLSLTFQLGKLPNS